MKNKLIILLLFGASRSVVNAQSPLANTAWQGMVNAPTPVEAIIHYSTDSLYLHFMPDNLVGETMTYSVKGDTLTLQKVSGSSPCDTQAIGVYQFAIKDDAMTIRLIGDDCVERVQAWGDKPFARVAVPTK